MSCIRRTKVRVANPTFLLNVILRLRSQSECLPIRCRCEGEQSLGKSSNAAQKMSEGDCVISLALEKWQHVIQKAKQMNCLVLTIHTCF